MIHRALDTNNDWTFGKGKASFTRKMDALVLNVKTRLRSWRGDCFFATAEGVDYNNFLNIGTKVFLDSDVKRVILQSEGILQITSYESTIDEEGRGFTAQVSVQTIYGAATFEV